MLSDELLLLASLLIFAAVLVTKVGSKLGAPSLLLFLLLGMLAGSDGLGLSFDNYELAESIGHFAMTAILFGAGLTTSWEESKPVIRQGILLSSLGVFLTALLTGLFIYFTVGSLIGGIAGSLAGCLLIAAVMSSTDSASVFSILRGRRLHLRENLGPMLELESGSNDPMAYVLTIILVDGIAAGFSSTGQMLGHGALILLMQIAIGFAIGVLMGYVGKWLLEKIHLDSTSLYAILVLSIGYITNSFASLVHGNGLLALYVCAMFIGNRAKLDYRKDVVHFFDGITWLMQLIMFLMLGLLVRPSQMGPIILPALLIGLFMMVIARPASVFLMLSPFRNISARAKTLVSWVGLKGAGPILFALCPVVEGLEGATDIFNIVFLISLLSLIMQGFSLAPMAHALKLSYEEDPVVDTFGIDVPEEMGMLRDHTVTESDLVNGGTLRDLMLPHGIRVMMVRREGKFLVPHGSMKLQVGDKLVIIMGDTDD